MLRIFSNSECEYQVERLITEKEELKSSSNEGEINSNLRLLVQGIREDMRKDLDAIKKIEW